jgi:hypothetical protein
MDVLKPELIVAEKLTWCNFPMRMTPSGSMVNIDNANACIGEQPNLFE